MEDGHLSDRRDPVGGRGRFEHEETGVVSFADYRMDATAWSSNMWKRPRRRGGGGAAGRLMAAIVAMPVAEGREIVPECGYAAAWLARRGVPERIRKGPPFPFRRAAPNLHRPGQRPARAT